MSRIKIRVDNTPLAKRYLDPEQEYIGKVKAVKVNEGVVTLAIEVRRPPRPNKRGRERLKRYGVTSS